MPWSANQSQSAKVICMEFAKVCYNPPHSAMGFVSAAKPDPFGNQHNLTGVSENRIGKKRMEAKLYVGNLPFVTTEEEIRTLFGQAGQVVSVDLIKDRDTGNSKGFAFVMMSSQSEAEKAISMFNGYSLNNRELKVNPARPREDSGRSGFGGGYRSNKGSDRRRSGPPRRDRRGGSSQY